MLSSAYIVSSPLHLAQHTPSTAAAGPGNLVLWAALLLGIAVLLFFLEVMIPSGGIIGMFSAVSLIAGIVMLFRIDTTVGLVGAIGALVAVPFMFGFALKIWPHTPIGRKLTLGDPDGLDVAGADAPKEEGQSLVGKTGRALTDLRPVGTCLIDGQRMDCMSEHGLIRAESRVRVVTADGMQTKVVVDE